MLIEKHSQEFPGRNYLEIKEKMLNWLKQFNIFCLLENHAYTTYPSLTETIVAVGCKNNYSANAGKALEGLQQYLQKGKWYFGHLGYDLKNEIEILHSNHPDNIGFPDIHFFEPETVIEFTGNDMIIHGDDPQKILNDILQQTKIPAWVSVSNNVTSSFSQEDYINSVEKIKSHILRGDCYELNFCIEFNSTQKADPFFIYQNLTALSPNPFSAFYRLHDKYVCCASPERFLCQKGNKLISQPIKGTSKRQNDPAADETARKKLFENKKERAENVMVVDLVRNDLSKVCENGSVQVDELFGIYTFPQVHQMISTVSGVPAKNATFSAIIRALFPMGSMTGAPKKSVMSLIEKYERCRRGIFSGSIGYIRPGGDFDLNVVIRSLLYNDTPEPISYPGGSAITGYSDPEKEWDECLLKAEAIKKVLALTDQD